MLDPERTPERELLLKRLCELDRAYAENQQELWDVKKRQASRLPIKKQLTFYLREYLQSVK